MTDKNDPRPADYDPYAKEREPQYSMRELLNQQKRIQANIDGVEFQEAEEEEEETIDPESMTVAELKAALDEAGVAYESSAKKADLVEAYSAYLAEQQD